MVWLGGCTIVRRSIVVDGAGTGTGTISVSGVLSSTSIRVTSGSSGRYAKNHIATPATTMTTATMRAVAEA